MYDDKDLEATDVDYQQINYAEGEIIFRKGKKRRIIKVFFKGLSFILIAAISGGITGAIVARKSTEETKNIIARRQTFFSQVNNPASNYDLSNNTVTRIAQIVGPAVVGISNKEDGFLGEIDGNSGSGIIFNSSGLIVTNYHVINNSTKIIVKLTSGRILEAKIIGVDQRSDLAVIKINAENLPVAKFGDSSRVQAGDLAVAIGNPLGEDFAGTVTSGIISAVNRKIKMTDDSTGETTMYNVIQTDAAINPGNSGGALCNENGEVIGINSLKIPSRYNVEGMGFAIAINEAKDVITLLTTQGTVVRPYLGVTGQTVISVNQNGQRGVLVSYVDKNSCAAVAGIKPTDVITELGKMPIVNFDDLTEVLDKHKIGDVITCKVLRDKKLTDIKIILTGK